MPIDDFERLLLRAINHYNGHTDVSRLLTAEMAEAGVKIYPAAIHDYIQEERRGPRARRLSATEVYDRFLPWKPKACIDGVVRFERAFYSSAELKALAHEHSRFPAAKRLTVELKRIGNDNWFVLCRDSKGNVFELEMTEEDKRRFRRGSFKSLELQYRNISLQQKTGINPRKARNAGKLSATQQDQVDAFERGRGNSYAGAVGSSRTQAKSNGRALRDEELGDKQRNAYLPNAPARTPPADNASEVFEDFDDPLAAAARSAEKTHLETRH